MIAAELITNAIEPIHTSDSIQKVFGRMIEFRVRHLPIVNEDQFLGLIAEEDMTAETDTTCAVGSLALSLINPYVFAEQHVYDVIRCFYEQHLTVVPVLDNKKNYQGMISINTMNNYFAQFTSATEPGGVIVLEITNKNNSLSHMAQIIESDNAQVLSSYVRTFPESTKMEVTLKVNKQDISGIVATFLRYEYDVKATFNHTEPTDDSMDRFDSFMNYLNM